mmetsp:Transcript_15112/g.23358  ORF Transcript_15112/g.23358 Transcript_15112/m.23358 type:complete len:179 (+) Transcript_15112:61-597(+)
MLASLELSHTVRVRFLVDFLVPLLRTHVRSINLLRSPHTYCLHLMLVVVASNRIWEKQWLPSRSVEYLLVITLIADVAQLLSWNRVMTAVGGVSFGKLISELFGVALRLVINVRGVGCCWLAIVLIDVHELVNQVVVAAIWWLLTPAAVGRHKFSAVSKAVSRGHVRIVEVYKVVHSL